MLPPKKFVFQVAALVAALFLLLSVLVGRIDRQRRIMGLEQELVLMPGHIAGNLVLLGFRGLAADLLWLQIEDLHHGGKYHQMLPLFRAVTILQPKFITPWAVGGWHMAYNIFARAESEEEKAFWLRSGIEFLKEGITHNRERYDLYFELGWTYYDRVRDFDKAVEHFSTAVRFPAPAYVENMLAHALFRAGREDDALELWRAIEEAGGQFSEVAGRLIRNVLTFGHPTFIEGHPSRE